jgi:hypothetical protein
VSANIVDDLQEAEDHIGQLRTLLEGWVEATLRSRNRSVHTLRNMSRAELAVPWCRPTCLDHDHDDPDDEAAADCGCPAHD